MKEINDEIVGKIKEGFKKYRILISEKKNLSDHNKDMKKDFIKTNFDEEDAEDKKRLKKEISKYLTSIMEVDKGTEVVSGIKDFRKTHLDLPSSLHENLIKIYKQIIENNNKKDSIDDQLDTLYMFYAGTLGISKDVMKGVFKIWRDFEIGNFPVSLDVVDAYRKIIEKAGN